MKPSIRVLTLGVGDLERAVVFYRDGLGLPTKGVVGQEFEDGAVAFFEMGGGLTLALYPLASLAKEAGAPVAEARPGAVSIGHNVGSREEVDAVMQEAERAGALVTSPARERFWGGYAGHFRDPDGHLWEIAWNPAWDAPR